MRREPHASATEEREERGVDDHRKKRKLQEHMTEKETWWKRGKMKERSVNG